MNASRLACVFIACAGQVLAQPVAAPLSLQPGEVAFDPAKGISGSFVLVQDPAGLWSTGRGGACLLVDVSASLGATPCVVQDDCEAYLEAFRSHLPAGVSGEGAYGYCVQPGNATEPKRCWVRPGAQQDYCVVSPGEPLPLDLMIKLPKSPKKGVAAFPLADGQPVRWMVNTCLNGFDFSQPGEGKDRLGCKGEHPQSLQTRTGRALLLQPSDQEAQSE